MTFNLLTVTGKTIPTTVEAVRQLHNMTAGDPGGVAAAKALGDMSHMVYLRTDAATNFQGDLLFMDIWNNLDGMGQFFSDAQVLGGAAMLFSEREAVVWSKLDSFLNYSFPAPTGNTQRHIGIVRGFVKSLDEAATIHNKAIGSLVNQARANGMLSHEFHARMAAPDSPEALEIIGIDVWMTAEGMLRHYMSPEFAGSGLYAMYASRPASSTWAHGGGEWVEW